MYRSLPLVVTFLLLFAAAGDAVAVSDQEAKMREVLDILGSFTEKSKGSIPRKLLNDAKAIAIIPSVVKVGLVVGGRYGKGVVTLRKGDGGWSNPLFLSLAGGSVGWQIGGQSTDVVLLFIGQKGVDNLMGGKFTLGADVSVAVGPVGGSVTAADSEMGPEIYTYSRSRGLFAGIAMDGARLKVDHKDNARYYKIGAPQPAQIISGDGIAAPASTKKLHDMLNGYIK